MNEHIYIVAADANTGYDETWCEWYLCPNCDDKEDVEFGCLMRGYKYCPYCGAKLDWINFKQEA